MRIILRNLAIVAFTGLGALVLVGFAVHRALQRVPEFYAVAQAIPVEEQREAGYQLERGVLALHGDLRREGQWNASFSDEQVNGWLAVDLEEKFPDLLPPTIRDPRVAFETEGIRIACRYEGEGEGVSSVISLLLDVDLGDEPNLLAVRVCQARAGLIPLPLKDFLDQITAVAQSADIQLRWVQEEGDPVALVSIAEQVSELDESRATIDAIGFHDGRLSLVGRTQSPSSHVGGEAKRPANEPQTAKESSGSKDAVQR